MTRILLLRHGKRVSRDETTLLSEAGVKQAQETASHLEKFGVDTIFASPMKRTYQMAQIIGDHLHLPVVADDRLKERMIYDGRLGDTFEEFLQEWDKTMADREYQPAYGDTARRAGERLKGMLDELVDNKTYLLVSHGGIIGDVVRNIFSDEQLPFRTDPATLLSWIDISEASITELHRQYGKYELKRLNDTSHFKV